MKQRSIGRETAIGLAKTGWWHERSDYDIALFQLNTEELALPFFDFHGAVEAALGRPVFTHEFANPELLRSELLGSRRPPTMREIIALIPEDKRIIVDVGGAE
jgi:hypothetical protein